MFLSIIAIPKSNETLFGTGEIYKRKREVKQFVSEMCFQIGQDFGLYGAVSLLMWSP